MAGCYADAGRSYGSPRRMTAVLPVPTAFKVSGKSTRNASGMKRAMVSEWPPKDWIYSGLNHPDGEQIHEYADPMHGGPGGGGNGVGVVPPMDQPSSYARRYLGEYRVPDHGFGIPMAPPTASGVYGGVPPMGHPSSYEWGFPSRSFGIPMTPPTARVPSTGQPWNYTWSNPVEYVVPDPGVGVPDRGFGIPDFCFGVPESGFGVHRTPPTMSSGHNVGKGRVSAEQGAKQARSKPEAAASGSHSRKRDLTTLLEGFTVIEEVRKGGKSIGHKDKYYIHIETGKKLRSLEEVERFKTTGSAKKPRPIPNISASNATHIGQPLQQPMQQPSQQVAGSSAEGEQEGAVGGERGNAAGGIPPETFS